MNSRCALAGLLLALGACPAPLPEGKCNLEQACPDGFMCTFEEGEKTGGACA
jgi:hypothetical protein